MFPFPFSFVAPTASGLADIDNVYSMEFDGVDDYFDLGSGLDYFDYESGSYTVSCWTNWTVKSFSRPILNFGANNFKFGLFGAPGNATQGQGNGMSISIFKGGNQKVAVYNWYNPGVTLNDGNWHHICVVVNQNAAIPTYEIYIDADNSGSGSATGLPIAANNTISGSTKFFAGKVDEVAVFDYALDSGQIDEIYNATSTGKTADLSDMATPPVAWYRMGD